MYGSLIPVVEDFKFLGIIFDRKLSFIPHIIYLKAKCLKALNLLKVLSHTNWGADRTVLLQLFRSLIRSKLDYGSIVYGSARKSYLMMLDTVHHQGLRLKHHEISSSKSVIYCWIPSHIGIYGNEKVDKSAKESLNLEVTDFKIPFNNFKPFINKYVSDKWQTLWDETPFNKLKEIEPIVNHHRLIPKLSRREEIVLARL